VSLVVAVVDVVFAVDVVVVDDAATLFLSLLWWIFFVR
jgi:hypothetical protein